MGVDRASAERAIEAFLRAIGHDKTSDPELAQTPARVTDAFLTELLTGYDVDIDALLVPASSGSPSSNNIVALRDVRVQTLCPHHLLPGMGVATVAYLPGPTLLGIGTIARLVEAYSRRLTLQETIGRQVVDTLVSRANARGAYCRIDMHHTCLSCRGARQVGAIVTTTAAAGHFSQPEGERQLYHVLSSRGAGSP